MQPSCNIYQRARNAKGLTQERAAEFLGISPRSLADYEAGVRFPPDKVATQMVDIYDSQLLAVQHLRQSAALAYGVIPDVPDLCLSQAALNLIDTVYAFADDKLDRELINICRDGVISQEEQPRYNHIMQQLSEITSAAMALMCSHRDRRN